MNRISQALGGCARAQIRPLVRYLVQAVSPASVTDYGCGDGAWLSEFRATGVEQTIGIDRRFGLRHEVGTFVEADLSDARVVWDNGIVGVRPKAPSLAVCVELAEHLPEKCAPQLVSTLARHDAVAFSAAIPGQGGWGHRNEQWQSWWAELFAGHGFAASLGLRREFWEHREIPVWYRQNLVLYRKGDVMNVLPSADLDVVHPDLWRRRSLMGLLAYWRSR